MSSSAPALSAINDHTFKHLELIQAVIARMAQNSFFIKGWSIALVTATLAVASQKLSLPVSLLALFPAVAFWLLDAYYLRQERLYRRLYNFVAENGRTPAGGNFSMETSAFAELESGHRAFFSATVVITHLGIILVISACIVAGLIQLGLTK
jgi:hypothetical protein